MYMLYLNGNLILYSCMFTCTWTGIGFLWIALGGFEIKHIQIVEIDDTQCLFCCLIWFVSLSYGILWSRRIGSVRSDKREESTNGHRRYPLAHPVLAVHISWKQTFHLPCAICNGNSASKQGNDEIHMYYNHV